MNKAGTCATEHIVQTYYIDSCKTRHSVLKPKILWRVKYHVTPQSVGLTTMLRQEPRHPHSKSCIQITQSTNFSIITTQFITYSNISNHICAGFTRTIYRTRVSEICDISDIANFCSKTFTLLQMVSTIIITYIELYCAFIMFNGFEHSFLTASST
jgi:hypothetical protein